MNVKKVLTFALVGVLACVAAQATAQDFPPIRIYPSGDQLKLVYKGKATEIVKVNFYNSDSNLVTDKIDASKHEGGFAKIYELKRDHQAPIWVDVTSSDLSAKFIVTLTNKGQWMPVLESVTYSNPVASR